MFTILHTEAATGWGGQEIRVFQEARRVSESGHRVIVLCQPHGKLAVKCRNINHPNFSSQYVSMKGTLDIGAVIKIFKIIKREKVDIVHTHSSIDSWVASFAAKIAGVKIVRSRHVSIPVKNFFPRNLVYRFPDKIITSGDTIADIIKDLNCVKSGKIISIPTGVDIKRFSPDISGDRIKKEFNIDDSQPVIGKIAVIRSWKGHNYFIDAAEIILKEFPTALFLIVGSGVGYEEIKERVHLKGLKKNIIMTGFRDDVPEIMAALDIFVLASFAGEGIAQVIPQGFAMKRCLVATDAGGIPDIVKDGVNGILVPPRDSVALANAIKSLIRDPDRRQGLAEAGYKYAMQYFSEDDMIQKTIKVYEGLKF